jgi:hypothetical protein
MGNQTISMKSKLFLSPAGLWQLFLIITAPINFWAVLITLRDMDSVIKSTNLWEGIGASSYALMFALVESISILIIFSLLGLLLPREWSEKQKVLILGILSVVITVWGILKQINFELYSPQFKYQAKGALVVLLNQTARPVVYGGVALIALFGIILLSVILPVIFITYSEKSREKLDKVVQQVSVLSRLYVGLDILGLIIILIRNL